MNELLKRIHAAQVIAAEDAVVASIPTDLRENLRLANMEFQANGGCRGCGSQRIAVHYAACSETDDLY